VNVPGGGDPNGSSARAPGWLEVLLVSGAVVALVLGAAAVTGLLPTEAQRIVFHSPLAIGVLIVGTILVLWRVAGRRPPTP
jgi:FtsH-binding integral membrane protein